RQFRELFDDLIHGRQQAVVETVPQHQGVAQVVDVFGGAGEVYKLGDVMQLFKRSNLLLDEVLHCLDVVVGGPLDGLDGFGIFQAEVGNQLIKGVPGAAAQ